MSDHEREPGMQRSGSSMSQSHTLTPSRGGTLKKRQSLKKTNSLKRRSSVRSERPGSVKSVAIDASSDRQDDELYSAFYTPVPTTGAPTEILANRFQAWRKVLKDLITYFRDIQKSYDSRSKSLLSASNIINNTVAPNNLLTQDGIGEATHIFMDFHKKALAAGSKAKSIEEDVITQLTGLRSDLQQKIKEIKNLAGDFKNSVEKETEGTKRAVRGLQEALEAVDTNSSVVSGKGDPFIVRLGVDRQVERQIDEENYLHNAFLNLETSGRELESIVIGEIQKAYNAYAGILKREADEAYDTVERLRAGPIAMAKDYEWAAFVDNNEHLVDPRLPIRKVERILYPGKDHLAASEVRVGMLERKSKYLKSYTPGWYILSPTHLHEFKSADRINSQQPIMSLYLPEQKLGSHSGSDSSSHKFMLKGRQSGSMHRGHAWVFRAESYDTMLAWFEDIKILTEKTGEERNAFVRKHARSVSGGNHKAGSVSSDGALDDDEADRVPYSATSSILNLAQPEKPKLQDRPQPGGRFPSDLNLNRDLQVPLSPSSGTSSDDREILVVTGSPAGSRVPISQAGRSVQHGEVIAKQSGANGDPSSSSQQARNKIVPKSQAGREYQEPMLMQQSPNPAVSHHLNTNHASVSIDTSEKMLVGASEAEHKEWPVESRNAISPNSRDFSYRTPHAQLQENKSTTDAENLTDDVQPGERATTTTAAAGGAAMATISQRVQNQKDQSQQRSDKGGHQNETPFPVAALAGEDAEIKNTNSVAEDASISAAENNHVETLAPSRGPIIGGTTSSVNAPFDSIEAVSANSRPPVGTTKTASQRTEQNIIKLHVPGEYPPTPISGAQVDS